MKLSFDGRNFIFKSGFENRHLPKKAGLFWDSTNKNWTTRSAHHAARLREFADEGAKEELEPLLLVKTPWAGRVLYPKNQTPKPFQLDYAKWILDWNRTYVGARPGTGKTIIAAMVINSWDAPTLYICPPFLLRDMKEKIQAWLTKKNAVKFFSSPKDFSEDFSLVNIIPDSILQRDVTKKFVERFVDQCDREPMLIVDETQRYSKDKSQRSKALYKSIAPRFKKRVFLSGTSMQNRPMELWPILSTQAPETINFIDKFSYGLKYCAGFETEYGWDFTGESNLEELHTNTRKFMRVVEKEDVLKDLPDKTREAVLLSDALPADLLKMEAKVLRAYSPQDLMKKKFPDHIATYRRELGLAKVKSALKFLSACLEDGEKMLVFAVHKETVKLLKEGLTKWKPLVITGDTPMKKRSVIAKEFQSKDSRRVFIGNVDAAGIGLDLFAAHTVNFVEFSWVPAANRQAEDRAHRIGQTRDVHCRYLVFEDSLDRRMLESVLEKEKITSKF